MNKQDLLQLEKLATLKPTDIQKENAVLFGKLTDTASLELKNKVETKLKGAPAEIKAGLKKVDFSAAKLGKLDVKAALAKNLVSGRMSAENKKELESAVAKIPDLGKIENVLLPDMPVFINPLFQKDLQKAKVYRLNNTVGISDTKMEKLIAKGISLNNLEEEKLAELVKNKTISKKEAEKLGLASTLHTLVDGSFELTEVVGKKGKLNDLSDLVKVSKADWKQWIVDSKMELAEGVSADDYADFMTKKVEHLFPEVSLIRKTTQVKTDELQKNIKGIQPLLKNNKSLFGIQTFDELDTKGLTAAQVKKLKSEYDKIDKLVKINPGLQLDKVINDKDIKLADKGKVITERIGLLEKFQKQNQDVHFLSLEYKHDSEDIKLLNFQGFSGDEKSQVLNNIKAQQRIYSFTDDIEATQQIMAAGFHSSFHITSVTLDEFAKKTKLDKAIATKYFENAHAAIIRTTAMMGSILDVLTGSFDWTKVGNTGPSIKDYLRDIPGYQDLFGELAFCDCQHCQSIYSPAAYFVDLMQFVERYVIDKHFTGTKAGHVLNLKTRRPDLWALELNCENTSTLMPSLDIINEILESYIVKNKGFTGNLSDIGEVENFVYKREIALEKPGNWKNQVRSFNQPFHLPMESVQTYLRHFEKTREDIAILLKKAQSDISKSKFQLSEKEYQLVTSTDATPAFIQRVYGLNFTVTSGKITPINAQDLLKPTSTNRKELGRLLKTRYITNNGADNIVIQSEKKSAESIQNDIERVKNLTYTSLDRLHRFVRLWRKTKLAIEELDFLIGVAFDKAVASELNADIVTVLGKWLRLKETLDINVEELAGLIHLIPAVSLIPATSSGFDIMNASQEKKPGSNL